LKLGETPIWLRFQQQSYSYKSWDREQQRVVEVEDCPWLEYATHYYPKKRQSINCSAGPYRKKPCFPCAIASGYWDKFREKEEEMRLHGIDGKLAKNPPINRSVRNAMALIGVDTYLEVPLLDKDGKPRKNAKGEVIKKHVAAPVAKFPSGVRMPEKEGHNMYWQFAGTHLEQLQTINEKLADYCGNCATPMYASKLACADCGSIEEDFGVAIEGEDLFQLRSEEIKCRSCHSEDVVPVLECPGCEEPAEGGLMGFDLRLKAIPMDDKKWDLDWVGTRIPNYSDTLLSLYDAPLDVEAICAPTPVNLQKSILGDLAQGVDPSAGAFTESNGPDKEKTEEEIPY